MIEVSWLPESLKLGTVAAREDIACNVVRFLRVRLVTTRGRTRGRAGFNSEDAVVRCYAGRFSALGSVRTWFPDLLA